MPRSPLSLSTALSTALTAALTALALGTPAHADQTPQSPVNPPTIAPGKAQPPVNTPPPARIEAPGNTNPKTVPVIPTTVSRAAGAQGGIVVLWPRVIPSANAPKLAPVATDAQARLSGLVAQTLPGRPIELRPNPERSCPQGGCKGVSVGVLIANKDEGCAAVALVGQPGQTPRRLIPWAGRIERKAMSVAFREPPESYITITEFTPCATLGDALEAGKPAVAEAIRFAVGTK